MQSNLPALSPGKKVNKIPALIQKIQKTQTRESRPLFLFSDGKGIFPLHLKWLCTTDTMF